MSVSLDAERLQLAFGSRPDILQGIDRAADSPGRVALFNEIASHVIDRLQESGGPAQKRRKVDNGSGANGVALASSERNAADEPVLLEIKEISVSVPQRKKFELCFTANHLYARVPGTTTPIPAITYPWKDIEYAFYLPVPEKTQVQHNYVLFPRGANLPSRGDTPSREPLVFTVPATAPKEGTISGREAGSAAAVSDTYRSLFHWAIHSRLDAVGNPVRILSADPNKFHSVIRQSHRPKEKAVHVGGYRGNKDGYLFFLETGILWGFKKPLIFIPLDRIFAISYTSILQVTFNIVVEVFTGEDGEATEEFEFGMLDQQDYGGIDGYIKDNRLQDRSMAEQRKAKLQLAENRGPKQGADGEEGGSGAAPEAGGQTELERAQAEAEQQLQDDEDEDEEDYDPGSEGGSEGSGDSSEDEDDDDDDDDDNDDDGDGEDGEGEEEGEEEDDAEQEEATGETAPQTGAVPVRSGWAALGGS
ncbi:Histone chaperone-like protein [Hapsidospora chrysogenum ATCC 11550]|uniref:Histone chaperone-like protein n=1 Tax=Hapsidospora chrysogenum (strain ATCC 11550 / CBS 779.69 / DSM 880 / IAM 14645 / JCM 23072 / IMI 49137) TaxID=857340 RepID=A0A086SUI6_HAPC1|nr:Histone chaperone-like protein [Hapsidospora chrysogenum ATCC 11550]